MLSELGMDPAAKAATRELILARRDAGATILLTTHELPDVERLIARAQSDIRGAQHGAADA